MNFSPVGTKIRYRIPNFKDYKTLAGTPANTLKIQGTVLLLVLVQWFVL